MKMYAYAVLIASCLMMAGCSKQSSIEKASQEFNSLPPVVQRAVRSRAPTAEIASVDRKTRDNMSYYVVEFKEPGRNPKLIVAENGTILSGEPEKAMGSGNQPPSKETGGAGKPDSQGATGAPEGTTGRAASIDLSALPVPVQKTLKSQAPNATIKGINRSEENGRTIYEFEFEEPGTNPTMRIAEDGTVVQSLKK